MTHVVIRTQGIKEWNARLSGMKSKVLTPEPYLRTMIVPDLERVEMAIFRSQGRRGGGSWKHLNQDYLIRKIREGKSTAINVAWGNLLNSLVDSDSDGAVRQIVGDRLFFGSNRRGAAQSQKYRPILRFTVYDRERWGRLWLDYITKVTNV